MTVRTTGHRATILALGLALSLVFAVLARLPESDEQTAPPGSCHTRSSNTDLACGLATG